MRFDASPWFSCHFLLFFFFQRTFGSLRKGRDFPDRTFNTYIHTSEASYYDCKPHSQGLDTIETVIACNRFSADGIDRVFNSTIPVGFRFASCENANQTRIYSNLKAADFPPPCQRIYFVPQGSLSISGSESSIPRVVSNRIELS